MPYTERIITSADVFIDKEIEGIGLGANVVFKIVESVSKSPVADCIRYFLALKRMSAKRKRSEWSVRRPQKRHLALYGYR